MHEGIFRIKNKLYESANNANKYANILGPINAQLEMSHVLCAIVGGMLVALTIAGLH